MSWANETARRRCLVGRWIALLAGLQIAVGCRHPEEASAEIRVGCLLDRPRPIAEATLQAAQLAVETVNAAGGIEVGGRSFRVVMRVADTGDTPEGATRASLELINREKVVAIVGSSYSRNAIPSGAVAEKAGIPMICPGSTHPQTTAGRRYLFRVSLIDPFQGSAMARFARQRLDLTTAAVLFDVAETYSRDIAAVFRRDFEAAGGRVVAFESFTTGERDFTQPLERIRAAEPEILFLPNFSSEVLLQSQQARRLGIDAVLLGSDGWPTRSLRANPQLDGAFFSLSWHRDLAAANPETQDFIARYRKAYGVEPEESAAMTYDAFGLLFAAITAAAETDPEPIRSALARLEGYAGVTGPITFRGTGGDPRRNAVIVQIRDGDLRLFEVVEAGSR